MHALEGRIPTDGTIGPSSEWGYISFKGFYAKVAPASMLIDEDRMFTPDETLVCKIDFVPTGNLAKRVYSLMYGLSGLFAKIDQGMPEPEYLYGETNKKFAALAARYGFEVTQLPEIEGDIECRVVGRTKEVRKRFDERLKKSGDNGRNIIELLNNRVQTSQNLRT